MPTSLYGNATLPTQAVPIADLQTVCEVLTEAVSTQIQVTPIDSARLYKAQSEIMPNAATGAGTTGEWISAGICRSSRGTVVADLPFGSTHNFRGRAVDNSTVCGKWSNPSDAQA